MFLLCLLYLSIPTRTLNSSNRPQFLHPTYSEQNKTINDYFHLSVCVLEQLLGETFNDCWHNLVSGDCRELILSFHQVTPGSDKKKQIKTLISWYFDLDIRVQTWETDQIRSFGRAIRIFRSQDAKIASRPSSKGKSTLQKFVCYYVFLLISLFNPFRGLFGLCVPRYLQHLRKNTSQKPPR